MGAREANPTPGRGVEREADPASGRSDPPSGSPLVSFDKILVANRGEIARRVLVACRRLGIAGVAIYSDPDGDAPFVAAADQAVPLGGSAPAESYLDIEKVIAAARATEAEAVHPGYGFLAENAGFARAVIDAGLVWIGPPPEAIEAMGSKVRARALMERAGVPVVPGAELGSGWAGSPSKGGEGEDGEVAAIAERIGYPLLVKASAGGGGKGMRPVAEASELGAALDGARREAKAAFGDGTVFLERYLQRPRHIEIQVFADAYGRVVSLGERECSLQRRHQKVVEEAPSPAVSDELRERLGAAAVAAAEAVGYVGAGTVEFLLEEGGEFFFLEMNTRLQVEHPVTELAYGVDLVAEQLAVAAGKTLSPRVATPKLAGHAIEVRLYAEDPAAGFLPQTGMLSRFRVPGAEPFAAAEGAASGGLRIDSGVEDGSVVGPDYDPMLAKLIAWAPTREEARRRLAAALRAAEIDGPVTNRDFLVAILQSAEFRDGRTDTDLIEREDRFAAASPVPAGDVPAYAVAAALAAMAERRATATAMPFAPPGFRNNPSQPQTISFEGRVTKTNGTGAPSGDRDVPCDLVTLRVDYALRRDGLTVSVEDEPLTAPRLHSATAELVDLEVAGVRRRYRVRRVADVHHVNGPRGQLDLTELPRFPSGEDSLAAGALLAPMPGKVLKLVVEQGATVEAGQALIVLEAMKMEHELTAPTDGAVAELRVAEGDQVEAGNPLVVIEPT